ncbi:hypothetical protein B0H17DRAFT_1097774 [Mycena rosella]|uniref:DUF6534 domain-containing protein n=1 Tax=Mycena rosella TaxID=1033263 RepID=A0AAD7G1U1_MYCRO|nr:hypothetical protein B0H17DRAFT_1097774 [Mycena rosella]
MTALLDYIGTFLNWMFMGILVVQYYTYYQTFPTERLALRILVNALFVLDLAQTIISTHFGWFFIIVTWGNPGDFNFIPWSASMIPILCGIGERIWVLAPNWFFKAVSALVVLLAFTQGTAAVLAGALILHTPTKAELTLVHPEITLGLSTSLTVDVIIATSMTFFLIRVKQQSTWGPTETMLAALIHRVVQTGAASAVCAAVDLAMFVIYPATNYHSVPAFILGKVYTNSLMLTLNLRRPTTPTSNKQSGVPSFRKDETHERSVTGTLHVKASPVRTWNQNTLSTSSQGTEEYLPKEGGFVAGANQGASEQL